MESIMPVTGAKVKILAQKDSKKSSPTKKDSKNKAMAVTTIPIGLWKAPSRLLWYTWRIRNIIPYT